jgi:integrase
MTRAELQNKLDLMPHYHISIDVIALVDIIFQGGLRISDAMRINFSCIDENLNIVIHQGKGSKPLRITPVNYRDYWRKVYAKKLTPYQHFNYMFFYRLFKKFGLVIFVSNGKNSKVTHSGRFLVASEVYEKNENIELVSDVLGHKSVKSTEHYLPHKKLKNESKGGIFDNPIGTLDELIVKKNGVIYAKKTKGKLKTGM